MNTAAAERTAVFMMAVVQFANVSPASRGNLALRTFAEALGLEEDEYIALTASTIAASEGRLSPLEVRPDAEREISLHIMGVALGHLAEKGFGGLSIARLRQLDLLSDATPPAFPDNLLGVLQAESHTEGAPDAVGPLVFILQQQAASVLALDDVLLHPDHELRTAALGRGLSATSQRIPWLTTQTKEILRNLKEDVGAAEEARWRTAAITASVAVRDDFRAHLFALRQSLAYWYQEGIGQYIGKVLRPKFSTVINIGGHLQCPSDQREEIAACIEKSSTKATIAEALSSYFEDYGYMPLIADLGTPAVARQWIERNPGHEVSWRELWDWTIQTGSVLARYHAVVVALHVPALRPKENIEAFLSEIMSILDIGAADGQTGGRSLWQFRSELAGLYVRSIEAMHPGSKGEWVGCLAWWLSHLVAEVVGNDLRLVSAIYDRSLISALHYSYFQWSVSRSPVAPSVVRHLTLHAPSIWSVALLAHLGSAVESLGDESLSREIRERIGRVLNVYLVVGGAARSEDDHSVYAFEAIAALERLTSKPGFVPDDAREMLSGLFAFWKDMEEPGTVKELLEKVSELVGHGQFLAANAIKDVVFSSNRYDEVLSQWLDQSSNVVNVLAGGDTGMLEPLLDGIAEFQQRYIGNWPTRIPQLIAFALEQCSDAERAGVLGERVLQMSINTGIVSPIQRMASSGSWADWRVALTMWRENLLEVGRHSEPWVAARVRAVSAAVSKLVGPRVAGAKDEVPGGDKEDDHPKG
jgi:hypothetical protein